MTIKADFDTCTRFAAYDDDDDASDNDDDASDNDDDDDDDNDYDDDDQDDKAKPGQSGLFPQEVPSALLWSSAICTTIKSNNNFPCENIVSGEE